MARDGARQVAVGSRTPFSVWGVVLAATLAAAGLFAAPQRAPQPTFRAALPLRVAAAPFASNDSTASVAVVVEIDAGRLKHTGGIDESRVRLSVGFYDRDGKSVAGSDQVIDLPERKEDVLRSVSWIAVPPGVYRLWVGAVQTPSGIAGSAMTDVEIPDFSRPRLALSGVTVSSGATPLARRQFSPGSDLFLYGEIYDRRPIAGPIRATVTITSQDAKVVYAKPFEPISATAGHQAHIPLNDLPPGAYLATVEVVSVTPRRAQAARTIAFTVIPR